MRVRVLEVLAVVVVLLVGLLGDLLAPLLDRGVDRRRVVRERAAQREAAQAADGLPLGLIAAARHQDDGDDHDREEGESSKHTAERHPGAVPHF